MEVAAADRFAGWPHNAARAMLVVLLAVLVVSALVPITRGAVAGKSSAAHGGESGAAPIRTKARDDDLRVYDNVIARIRAGESYYSAVVAEHRAIGFPLQPGLAVRLPTLAYIEASLGRRGEWIAAVLLLAAVLIAWWRRLGTEPGSAGLRLVAIALLAANAALGLNAHFFRLHELWAGMLLALSFGLHRPHRWGWSWAVAGLALAIRELALPFVLLMAAIALWRKDWRQCAAWGLLAALFVAGLAWHLQMVGDLAQPDDRISASWLELRGLSGWLSNVVLSSNLRFLPHWLAGPLVVLMLLGWAGWRSAAGVFGTLFYLGYGLAFMIAGRGENYYWGAMVTPAMFVGLAFAPRALRGLWQAARAK